MLVFLNEVPLVDHHHDSPIAVQHVPEDVLILLLESLCGIDQQQTDVTLVNRLDRANRAVEFEVVVHLFAFPQASRVHNFKIETERIEARVHTVTRGARDVGHDVALLTEQGVDQRALAHIGPPHHCQLGQPQFFAFLLGRQLLDQCIQQIPRAVAIVCTDAVKDIPNAQSVEFRCRVLLSTRVNLVDHQHHWLTGPPNQLSNVLIQICDARLGVHHEHDERGFLHARLDLLTNHTLEDIIRPGSISPRVNHGEDPPSPERLAVFPISGGSRRGICDRVSSFRQPVEQGGLANVRPSDYGNKIIHGISFYRCRISGKKKGPPKGPQGGVDILSRSSSTICAGRLNFSVRNGKRWTLPQ